MAEVIVLRPGYAYPAPSDRQRAAGTISLVLGSVTMIVDTGAATDRQRILDALARHNLRPEDVDFVVCTHGHSDHIGNNNLFPRATFIVGSDLSKGDVYERIDHSRGPYVVGGEIQILHTPGHTSEDVSVLVDTEKGKVAIVGDLFESAWDSLDDSWTTVSRDAELQRRHRQEILRLADFIVPGHGDMFPVRGDTGRLRTD